MLHSKKSLSTIIVLCLLSAYVSGAGSQTYYINPSFGYIAYYIDIFRRLFFVEENIAVELALGKGFIQGVHKGFYNLQEYHPDEKCLGKPTLSKIMEIEYDLKHLSFSKLVEIIVSLIDIAYSVDTYCEVGDMLSDMFYQLQNEGVKSKAITDNLRILGFQLVAEITETSSIISDIQDGEIYNVDESITKMDSIGQSYGKEFRIILNYGVESQ